MSKEEIEARQLALQIAVAGGYKTVDELVEAAEKILKFLRGSQS